MICALFIRTSQETIHRCALLLLPIFFLSFITIFLLNPAVAPFIFFLAHVRFTDTIVCGWFFLFLILTILIRHSGSSKLNKDKIIIQVIGNSGQFSRKEDVLLVQLTPRLLLLSRATLQKARQLI
jgi:hypothetical protein